MLRLTLAVVLVALPTSALADDQQVIDPVVVRPWVGSGVAFLVGRPAPAFALGLTLLNPNVPVFLDVHGLLGPSMGDPGLRRQVEGGGIDLGATFDVGSFSLGAGAGAGVLGWWDDYDIRHTEAGLTACVSAGRLFHVGSGALELKLRGDGYLNGVSVLAALAWRP